MNSWRIPSLLTAGLLLVAGCSGDASRSPGSLETAEHLEPSVAGSASTPDPSEPDFEPTEPPTTENQSEEQPEAPSLTTPPAPTEPVPSGGWVEMEVTVKTPSEASKLTQTTPKFQQFVAERVGADDSGCKSQFTIREFHHEGFATGEDFAPGCGGAVTIWGLVDGEWETLMAMQEAVACSDIEANQVPRGNPDLKCLDTAGEVVDY